MTTRTSFTYSPSPSPAPSRNPSVSITHSPRITPSSSVASSRQTSLDIPRRLSHPKRTRSALRQFYGIPSSDSAKPTISTSPIAPTVPENELDSESLDPQVYVEKTLETKSVRELLRFENQIVNEILSLDSDRKALVYDNYSKLIAATATIRQMRASMEPLTPTTSTLEPAVSYIESVSRSLVPRLPDISLKTTNKATEATEKQKATVKWVLAAPERIKTLRAAGKTREADVVWKRLGELCDRWEGTPGVKEVRKMGSAAMETAAMESVVGIDGGISGSVEEEGSVKNTP